MATIKIGKVAIKIQLPSFLKTKSNKTKISIWSPYKYLDLT